MPDAQPALDSIKSSVKDFVLEQCLPGTNPGELTDATPLITGGILDSIATVHLVAMLEDRYNVEIAPHEASVDHLDTLESIAQLVHSKM